VPHFNFRQLARAAQELKIPYIASGGIADARGVAAALALGAAVRNTIHFIWIVLNLYLTLLGCQHG